MSLGSLFYYTGALKIYENYFKQSLFPLIFYYHRVRDNDAADNVGLSISVDNFNNQIKYFARYCNVVSLDFMVKKIREGKSLSPNDVAITFDDGYNDNYANAYPVLKKYNVPATIFLTTGYIGTNRLLWWDKLIFILSHIKQEEVQNIPLKDEILPKSIKHKICECVKNFNGKEISLLINELKSIGRSKREWILKYLEDNYGDKTGLRFIPRTFLSWDEIKEMANNGISFGSHTHTHSILTEISHEEIRKELTISKQIIEEGISKQISAFAYPDGCLNEEIRNIVKQSGYGFAVQTFRNNENNKIDLFSIPRKMIKEGHSRGIFEKFSKALFAMELSGILDKFFLRKKRSINPYKKYISRSNAV